MIVLWWFAKVAIVAFVAVLLFEAVIRIASLGWDDASESKRRIEGEWARRVREQIQNRRNKKRDAA